MRYLCGAFGLILILSGCRGEVIIPTLAPTLDNSVAATNTFTPEPTITFTDVPTDTDVPTATFTDMPTETNTVTATSTFTPSATATSTTTLPTGNDPSSILIRELHSVEGIRGTEIVSVTYRDNLLDIYAEILIEPGTDYDAVADAYMQLTALLFLPSSEGYLDLFAIIDDGVTAKSYLYDFEDDVWRDDVMESFNSTRATEEAGNNDNSVRPENCAHAIAMGLTPEQAAQWEHLDRDGDGRACEGG